SLPAIVSSHPTEDNLLEEQRTSEECEPPLQRLEEIETRGRNLQLREAMMNSAGSKEKSILGTIQNLFSKSSEPVYPVQSNLDQVQEWALKKQLQPSIQDRERWGIREKLDQLQTAISLQQKELKDAKNLLMEGKADDALGDDEDDGKSRFSTATKQTSSSKASSSFSASKSSIFSFSGKTLFNSGSKKESVSPLPSISEESSVSQDPQKQLRQLQEEASNLKKKYFELLTQAESERLGLSGQKAEIPFSEEADRNYAWEKADKKSVAAIKRERHEQEREKIAQEQQESWQSNTERWRAREQADLAFGMLRQAQDRTIKLGEEARKAKTATQLTEARQKKEAALAEEERLEQVYLAAEENWEKMAQEYSQKHSEQSGSEAKASERLKERDQAVNRRWEKLLKNYQNPEFQQAAVEQEEIGEAIMALKDQLEESYQSSFITHKGEEALNHYRELAFKRALENARNHPAEMAEAWDKIAATQKGMTVSQQEINKDAAVVFKEEVKRLEKIEKIWQGILEREREEAKQKSEQAAQGYYRGNLTDWHALSDQERERYNNEVRKANEEYEQKREEHQTLLSLLEEELQKTGKLLEVVKTKRKGDWRASSAKRHDQQIIDLGAQQEKLLKEQKKLQEDLVQQETGLHLGQKARQKENYYEALKQAQRSEGKAREGKNPYWEKAAECYRHASSYWKEAADDKTSGRQQAQKEKMASFYGRAAEAYEKAAQEQTALATTRNRSKETLIALYREEATLSEQLAEQWGKGESTSNESNIADIQEALYQLEKKIERYLGTRGAQIEELQENIPVLQQRCEKLMQEESLVLRQQGKEDFAAKQEALATSLRELLPTLQTALDGLFQETPESNEKATAAIDALRAKQKEDQELQKIIQQALQLEKLDQKKTLFETRMAALKNELELFQSQGEDFLVQGHKNLLGDATILFASFNQIREQFLTNSQKALEEVTELYAKLALWEQYDQQLEQRTTSLKQLHQKKKSFQLRSEALQQEIVTSQNQGEQFLGFLDKGQRSFLKQMKEALGAIDQRVQQLLSKTKDSAEQTEILFKRLSELEESDRIFQKNLLVLKKLNQHYNVFQERLKTLKNEKLSSSTSEESYLGKGREKLAAMTMKGVARIDEIAKELLLGSSEDLTEANSFLSDAEKLKQYDDSFQQNIPSLSKLDEKNNFFQNRLAQLRTELKNSNTQQQLLLMEVQQPLVNEMAEILSEIDRTAQLFLARKESAAGEMQRCWNQLEPLEKRDQCYQRSLPQLRALEEKRTALQVCVHLMNSDMSSSRQNETLFTETRKNLLEEIKKQQKKTSQLSKQLLSDLPEVSHLASQQVPELIAAVDQLLVRHQQLDENAPHWNAFEEKKNLWESRRVTLDKEIIAATARGENFLAQAQQAFLENLQLLLKQSAQIMQQLLATKEGVLKEAHRLHQDLKQLEQHGEQLQKNTPLLQQLDQKKAGFLERITELNNRITTTQHPESAFVIQGQEGLLRDMNQLLSEIDQHAEKLLARSPKSLEQANDLLLKLTSCEGRDQQLQENATFLQQCDLKKALFQTRSEALNKEIAAAQVHGSSGEQLLVEGERKLLSKCIQALSEIEQRVLQLLGGVTEPSKQNATLLTRLHQLEEEDRAFQKNLPLLQELHQNYQSFQARLKDLNTEMVVFRPQEKTYLNQGRKSLAAEISQTLETFKETFQQLFAGTAGVENKTTSLFAQLEELRKHDQALQENASQLREFDEKRNFFERRAEQLQAQIKVSQDQQQHL
ncbi:MAG TPA: hypothetical protein VJK54_04805, partial [Chthoniobacterales bacterium]|nr:hypothetical protein [Chthoniobacterales bacterium]